MYPTDEIVYSKSAPSLASGTTHYISETGVVTQSLNVADIVVIVDTELAAGTVKIDFDCLPRYRRICTPRPKVSHDRQGNLRVYQGTMHGSGLADSLPVGHNYVQERCGIWRAMSLTITIAPNVRYVNL